MLMSSLTVMIAMINRIFHMSKRLVRKIFNICGQQIVPLPQHPMSNGIGLNTYGIRTVFDLGANAGQFATRVHNWIPNATIYSFEPLKDVYAQLQQTFAAEGISGRCFCCAVGDKKTEANLLRHVQHTPSSSLLETTTQHEAMDSRTREQHCEAVQIEVLDDLIQAEQLCVEHEVMIKLDVQGYELHALKGAELLLRSSRLVLVEINLQQLYKGQPSFFELTSYLNEFGFDYAGNLDQWQARDGTVISVDAIYYQTNRLSSLG